MGNTEPKNSKLTTYIETQKPYYNSGSIIQGVVFIQAKQNFNYDALFIRVEGEQFCQWFEGSSKNRRKYTGIQNFYAVEHMLCRYDNTIQYGKYAYPFSLELSQNIPGTYINQRFDARVDYKIIAYFANFSSRKHRSLYSVPLFIRQPFRQQQCQYQGFVTQNPKSCLCLSKGQVNLHARFSTNVCYEGQEVQIEISCDNTKGKSNINRFGIDLVQYTFVSANNGVNRTYRKVINRQFLKTIAQKGSKMNAQKYSFKIPEVDHQTAISTLIANYFRLEVYADFGNMARNEPCIYSPLFIMKNKVEIKDHQKRITNLQGFKYEKKQLFKAPEYWFRKNRNLSVMNFRLEDNIVPMQSQPMLRR